MKAKLTLLTLILLSVCTIAQAQLKEYKAGHVFYVSLPEYFTKTAGINDAATIQFKNTIKDIYGYIIEDSKEDLDLVDMKFASIMEFFDYFINDLKIEGNERTVDKPQSKTIDKKNFIVCDVAFEDITNGTKIYYFVGIAETKDSYYKVLCLCDYKSKDTYKADFESILYSIRD